MANDRPGFTFLFCPDPALIKAEAARLAEPFGPFKHKVFWGDEDLPGEFWQELSATSLLGERTMLFVRRAQAIKADVWDRLAPALSGYNDAVWPLFSIESDWRYGKPPAGPKPMTRQKYFKVAEKRGWVLRVPGLTDRTLPDFVKRWCGERGVACDPRAVNEVARALPEDAAQALLELDKIELALGEDRALSADHASLVTPSGEMEFFDFVNRISARGADRDIWQRVIHNHAESESMLFQLVGYLAKEARTLRLLLSGEEDQVKLAPRARSAKQAMARGLGKPGTARLMDLALEAEISVKSGARSPEQALETLVAGLAGLFRAAPGR